MAAAGRSSSRVTISITTAAIPDTPAASPSSPSMKLMALAIPTSQNRVISRLNHTGKGQIPLPGRLMNSMRTPTPQAAAATPNCINKREKGDR